MSSRPLDATRAAILAGLRIYLGIVFLFAVKPKLTEPGFVARMTGFLENLGLEQGHAFYQSFIRAVALPHAEMFAALVVVAELLVGVLLVLGAATRAAAAVAAFLLLNYMFVKGMWFWMPASNDAALFAIAIATLVARSGRTFGLDARLAERWPLLS